MFWSSIARGLQLLFSVVALALPIVLLNGYGPGHAPSLLGYSAFCGGAALIISAIGIAALFFESVQGLIMIGLDGFAAFFLIAGAAAFSAKIGGGTCVFGHEKNPEYLLKIYSTIHTSSSKYYGSDPNKYEQHLTTDLEKRCSIAQADEAFLWVLVGCFIGTLVLSFYNRGGKNGGRSMV